MYERCIETKSTVLILFKNALVLFFKAFYPIFFVFILLIKICVWGSDACGIFVGSMFLINEICQFGGELYNQEISETDQ